ncbi:hypothetical protein [Streptomyces sp. enrichment culture]|uniref:hypothetical protein n=1 Tax=Streptomyces sp. enrichment culture TaxID=1795815 RepID=UPI003F55A3B1
MPAHPRTGLGPARDVDGERLPGPLHDFPAPEDLVGGGDATAASDPDRPDFGPLAGSAGRRRAPRTALPVAAPPALLPLLERALGRPESTPRPAAPGERAGITADEEGNRTLCHPGGTLRTRSFHKPTRTVRTG